MVMKFSSSVTATHNKLLARWFSTLSQETITNMTLDYAIHLKCPPCEICREFGDQDDKDYLWETYNKEIEAWNRGS